MSAAHVRKEGRGLLAATLLAPAPDRRAIAELVSDAAQAARPRTQQASSSFGHGANLNKSGPTS